MPEKKAKKVVRTIKKECSEKKAISEIKEAVAKLNLRIDRIVNAIDKSKRVRGL
ncbi:MAG: hypothetical protein KAS32_10735 [Candidatus Peribacteraceae bacterium]|nr:hypothetical protein [Candidatus Peribacteraceae bacterium]